MTETTFRIIDAVLIAAGGLVIVAALLHWRFGSPPHGRRDLLRHSPLRVNRLGILGPWICIMGWCLSGAAGPKIAPWLAPGLSGELLQTWQGNFTAAFANLLNILVCLLLAHALFARGLNGFGIGRRRITYEVAIAIAGWLAVLCLTGLTVRASDWLILRFFPDYPRLVHGVFQTLKNPGLPAWMRVFTIAATLLLVPIGEEVFFRGILQTALQRLIPVRTGSFQHRWAAIIIAGAAFGLAHSNTPQYIPALIAFGILQGFLYERTGSLTVPIFVHMLFNGKSLLVDFLARTYLQVQ